MADGVIPGDSARRPLLRADLNRIAARQGVPTEVIEKDYVLSYLLAGLTDMPDLGGLKFRGSGSCAAFRGCRNAMPASALHRTGRQARHDSALEHQHEDDQRQRDHD